MIERVKEKIAEWRHYWYRYRHRRRVVRDKKRRMRLRDNRIKAGLPGADHILSVDNAKHVVTYGGKKRNG